MADRTPAQDLAQVALNLTRERDTVEDRLSEHRAWLVAEAARLDQDAAVGAELHRGTREACADRMRAAVRHLDSTSAKAPPVTPIRPQVVPAYMDCTFTVQVRADGMPEIVGRKYGAAHYRVRQAPGRDGRWIAEEIADHLSGRLTAQRALGEILDSAVEIDGQLVVTLDVETAARYRALTETH